MRARDFTTFILFLFAVSAFGTTPAKPLCEAEMLPAVQKVNQGLTGQIKLFRMFSNGEDLR